MKNSQIHNGLPLAEVRDFLALSLIKLHKEQNKLLEHIAIENQKVYATGYNAFDKRVQLKELELKKLQAELFIEKSFQAIFHIAEMQGWAEYDVSDETIIAPEVSDDHWLSFFGTKSEYEALLKRIKYK